MTRVQRATTGTPSGDRSIAEHGSTRRSRWTVRTSPSRAGPFCGPSHARVRVRAVELERGIVDAEHDGYRRLAQSGDSPTMGLAPSEEGGTTLSWTRCQDPASTRCASRGHCTRVSS